MPTRAAIAVLFCDLVDSTAILARIGDAANDELRRDVFSALRRPVETSGGEEIKSQGDGLMATFATAEGAVACAVEMERAVARLDARDPALSLALRVGVAYGDATAEEDDWFGTPVVEAARLCSAARSRQILITDAARRRLRDPGRPDLADAGRLSLKGLPDARQAWSVSWSAEGRTGPVPLPPALQISSGSPLVGRDRELAELRAVWSQVRSGSTRAVVVDGPAGSGTSRLATALAGEVARDALVLYGRALAGGDGREAFDEALRWFVTSSPIDDLRRCTTGLRPAIDAALPSLAVRLGSPSAASDAGGEVPEPDGAVPEPEPEAEAGDLSATEVALLRLVGRLSRARPLLLVIDDAHLLGPTGRALLAELATGPRPERLLLLVLGRADEDGAASALDGVRAKLAGATELSELALGPLPVAAVAELLGLVADSDAADVAAAETGGNAAQVALLRRQLLAEGIEVGASADQVRRARARTSPYRGLAVYRAEDRDLFHGRDALRDLVLERLARARLVVLVGGSGSGKSSLVRAGVLPALADGALPGSATWTQVILNPGEQPEEALDAALGTDHRPRLVFVDQLEELFTVCEDEAMRRGFLHRLTAPVGDDPVAVIATLRADQFGAFASEPGMAAVLDEATLVVPPMSADELRSAIEGPAAMVGLRLEPGLLDLVVSEVGSRPGALPLVSHAMYETWRRCRGHTLTVAAYREAGGVEGAVARTAEDVYLRQLDGADQVVARTLLFRLTELGDGAEASRRRADRADLAGIGEGRLDVVLERLVAARLLAVDGDSIEIVHEALIRAWPRLQGWLEDDREALLLHRRLTRAATEWVEGGRSEAELYRGGRLETALDWRATHAGQLSTAEAGFLAASEELRRAQEAEAADRAARDRRSNRRLRLLLVAAGVAAVVATVAALLAVAQQNRAEKLGSEAAARAAAAQVGAASAQDYELGWLLAAESYGLQDLPETRSALFDSLTSEGRRVGVVDLPGAGLVVGVDEAGRLVSLGGEGLTRWVAATGEQIDARPDVGRSREEPGVSSVRVLAPDAAAAVLAEWGAGELAVTVWGTADGEGRWSTTLAAPGGVSAGGRVAVSDGGGWVAVARGGEVLVLSASDRAGWAPALPLGDHVSTLAIDPGGRRVATVVSDRPSTSVEFGDGVATAETGPATITVHDVATRQPVVSYRSASPVGAVTFSRDGRHLAVGLLADPVTGVSLSSPELPEKPEIPEAVRDEVRVLDLDEASVSDLSAPGSLLGMVGDEVAVVAGASEVGLWPMSLESAVVAPLRGSGLPSSISGDGRRASLITRTPNRTRVELLDLRRPQGLLGTPFGPAGLHDLHLTDDGLAVAQVSPVGRPGSIQADGTFTVVLDVDAGDEVARIEGTLGGLSDDGHVLVDGRLRRLPDLEPATGEDTSSRLSGGWLAPSGDVVVVAEPDALVLRDARTGGYRATLTTLEGRPFSGLAFAGDGSRVGVSFSGADPLFFDLPSADAVEIGFEYPPQAVSLALSEDGSQVAFALIDGDVTVRDFDGGGSQNPPLRGLASTGGSIRFLPGPDGSTVLVAVDSDGHLLIADADDGRVIGATPPATVSIDGADGAGGALVLATTAGVMELGLDPDAWAATACRLTDRDLTAREWDRYFPGRSPHPTCSR